jgi:phosphatidylserine decarboxylase
LFKAANPYTALSHAAYRKATDRWLADLIKDVANHQRLFHPSIKDFQNLIETNADIYVLFSEMFMPRNSRFRYYLGETLRLSQKIFGKALGFKQSSAVGVDRAGRPKVHSYLHMLELLNAILTKAPEYRKTDLIRALPILFLLDQSAQTQAGAAVFLNKRVNEQIRLVLNAWGEFLSSSESCSVLNTNPRTGWFGEDAMKAMPDFARHFVCDPKAPHYGFRSWDDFFTRRLKPGVRPIASPGDDSIIVNACESAPYNLAHNVQRVDTFWIKGRPYSLQHMLANDDLTEQFVGGTVYQGFLSATSYHRWHSPVSGRIVKAYVKSGTYYWVPVSAMNDSLGTVGSTRYIVETATRALIFIQADNPTIGLMCFMPVGMAEVSTCQLTVHEGQQVKKGDELGMFHYGGSTYCLVFGPDTKLSFDLHGQAPSLTAVNIPVNAKIATAM